MKTSPEANMVEPSILHRLGDRLDHRRNRYWLYVLVAVMLYLAGVGSGLLKAKLRHEPFTFIFGDGRGHYIYLPAVILDHTLNFENRMRQQFGPEFQFPLLAGPNARGYYRNAHPTGVAQTIWPAFLVAHGLSKITYGLTGSPWLIPDGYSLLYQLIEIGAIMALGMWGMMLIDRVIDERFRVPGRWIAAAIVAYWVGSNYSWYYFRDMFTSHCTETFWVSAAVFLVHQMLLELKEKRLSGWRLPVLAFCWAMALACRLTSVTLLPVFVYLLWRIIRAGQLRRALMLIPLALLCMAPLYVQMAVSGLLAPTPKIAVARLAPTETTQPAATQATASAPSAPGAPPKASMEYYGYNPVERFYWTRPKLWQTLFSSRNGLFFWSPVLLLGLVGLGYALVRGAWRDGLLLALLVYGLLLWYLNSAWYAWWFGEGFGHRASIALAPLVLIGMAFGFWAVARLAFPWRGTIWALVILAIGYNYLLMGLCMTHRIPRGAYLIVQRDGHWAINFRDGSVDDTPPVIIPPPDLAE